MEQTNILSAEKKVRGVVEDIVRKKELEFEDLPKLTNAYEYVRNNNDSNELPYHNFYHTLCVVKNCYTGALKLGLALFETYELILAALFHDYNHSGGELTDDLNISKALNGFESFLIYDGNFEQHLYDKVSEIIKVTQFPFVREPSTDQEKIIRDADLMQCYEESWYEHIIMGLRQEIEVSSKKEISVKEMLENQLKFISSSTFYTEWGQERFEKEWPSLAIVIKELIEKT